MSTNTYGIIDIPFTLIDKKFDKGFLYYGDSRLTDNYFIKSCYVFNGKELTNKGEQQVYVYGNIQKGDYLTTCKYYGVAIASDAPEVSFAVALEGKGRFGLGHLDNDGFGVHLINVKFL